MRCLITGISGFVGQHLRSHLKQHQHDVIGISRATADQSTADVQQFDLLDSNRLHEVLSDYQPEWIFHLAGYANTGKSFSEPEATWEGNLLATMNLYDVLAKLKYRGRVLFVSTGLVYGDASPEFPKCNEHQPLCPTSPYAASKAAADLLSFQQTRHPGLDIVIVRPFNHIGPGQSADYAASNFARQIAAIEAGRQEPTIHTGGLDNFRDFTDVRDMVRAYTLLMQHGQTGQAYNAGSGRTVKIRDLLANMLSRSHAGIHIQEKVDANRKHDPTIHQIDTAKLVNCTHWQPTLSLEQTIDDVLNDWRNRLKQSR